MKFSISITCGNPKAKTANRVASVEHNNRTKLTPQADKRIDHSRTPNNITFIRKPLEDVYTELFQGAVEKYNEDLLEKRKSGKTTSRHKNRFYKDAVAYLEKIQNSKQEKHYYESIITFGNKDTAGMGTANEAVAKKMLAAYMLNFQKRNQQLKVFNAVMHLDESTPHIHIDYVPWCNNTGKNGLSVKNSLSQALKQQGFSIPSTYNKKSKAEKTDWQLEAWVNSEKKVMIDVLKYFKFELDEKNENREHMSQDEYEEYKDIQRAEVRAKTNVVKVAEENLRLSQENQKLGKMVKSGLVSIKIPNAETQEHIIDALKNKSIQWIVEENAVVVPKWAEYIVQNALAEFAPTTNFKTQRQQMKFDIDKNIYYAKDFDNFLDIMRNDGYEVERRGQFLRFKPKGGQRFIRIDKSLGDEYTEEQLKHRIAHRFDTRNEYKQKSEQGKNYEKVFNGAVCNVAISYFNKKIQPKKYNENKPYTHENDKRVVQLIEYLNITQRESLTLSNLQPKIDKLDNRQLELIKRLTSLKKQYPQPGDSLKSELQKIESEISTIQSKLTDYIEIRNITEELRSGAYYDKIADKPTVTEPEKEMENDNGYDD